MPLDGRAAGIAATLFWTFFGTVCGLQVWLGMLSHGHSLPRMVLHYVAVWSAWILLTFAIAGFTRFLPLLPLALRPLLLHVLVACLVALAHAAWWVALVLLIQPYDRMNPTRFVPTFTSTAFFQLPLELVLYAAVAAGSQAVRVYAEARERELRAAQLERSLAQARLHALELQIQPHFLFNTLNAISALSRSGQHAQAQAMLSGLADLLRYALDRAERSVPLAEEAEMLRRYLEIQRLRFVDRLSFEIDVAPEAQAAAVPALLLQPLAENAVRHGIAQSAGPGRVVVRAFREEGALHVEMLNSGRLGPPRQDGIGVANTIARLQELYGAGQRFELCETADGVRTSIRIPWSQVA